MTTCLHVEPTGAVFRRGGEPLVDVGLGHRRLVFSACPPSRLSVRIGNLVYDSSNGVFPAVLSALSKERDGGAHVVGGGRRRCEGPH